MSQTIPVAVVQAASVAFDRERSIAKLAGLAADAARKGAKLVLFPEAFVPCYPWGTDFGARIGQRSDEGRRWYQRYHENAVDVPGPHTERIGRAARDNKIFLVVGVIERGGRTLYCTVLFFAPDGTLMGKHRKVMPTAMERLVWGFGDGSTLPVFDTELGRLGAVICWENYMPLMRMAMFDKGIELYCAPTADGRRTWASSMQHVALEGRCFVLSCNQFSRRRDFPPDFPCVQGDDPDTVMMTGGSCIVDPMGQFLAGPDYEGECILTAELDKGAIARGKYDFDVAGHYSRPDIFRLHVNESATPPVVASARAPGDPFAEEEG
ncbi:MAG: carbon-nitrogen hydrolase family protein [Alphaproteobacteria bacterium]